MNSQVWWFVARSSGIIAWALLSVSVIWGLLLSTKVSTTRIAARRLRPAWILDLHRHLGGLAVIFTAIHLIGIVADSYVTFSWADILVPMASEWKPGAVAFGVVAMYLLIAVEATSLAIRHLPRNVWRWVHRSSFLLYATATWHGVTAGTDAGNQWFQAAAWLSLILVIGLTVRLVLIMRRKSPVVIPATVTEPIEQRQPFAAPVPAPPPAPVERPAPMLVPAIASFRPSIEPLPGTVTEIGVPVGQVSTPHSEAVPALAPPARIGPPALSPPHSPTLAPPSPVATSRSGEAPASSESTPPPPPPPRPAPSVASPVPPPPAPSTRSQPVAERELVGVSPGRRPEGERAPRPTDS